MPSPSIPLPTNLRSVPGEGRFYASWRDEMVVIASGLAILVFVSSQTGFSVHSRYVIPALPFLFVWTSKVARVFERRPEDKRLCEETVADSVATCPHPLPLSRERARGVMDWLRSRRHPVLAVLVIFALTWSIVSSLSIYPHNLSYFNELAAILPPPADATYPKAIVKNANSHGVISTIGNAIGTGPRNGPRHLLDSNIDWGQDLLYLRDWLASHPDIKLDGMALSSSYPPALAGIPETPMPLPGRADKKEAESIASHPSAQAGPMLGWYALSVNYIYGRDPQYRYFLSFEPEATCGYSIYIYHITLDGANRVRREMGLSELGEECKLQNVK